MNNTFNLQRFGLLLKRQWLEFGKIYLVSLAVILGVFLCFYGYAYAKVIEEPALLMSRGTLNFREPLFIFGGFLFTSIIASNYFAHLGQKPKAIIDLMIPVSTFEKFLAGLFFTTFLGIMGYLLVFYLTDLAFISSWHGVLDGIATKSGSLVSNENVSYFFARNNPSQFVPIYFFPFLLTSIFLLGSVYFNKYHYIKTSLAVMLFSGLWTYINFKSGEWLMSGRIRVDEGPDNISKSEMEWYGSILMLLLIFIFWSITYVRLKEKEV